MTVTIDRSVVMHAVAPNGPDQLVERRRAVQRVMRAEGAGYLVHDGSLGGGYTAPPMDPLPVVISAAEFAVLEAAVQQRVRLLEATLADLYGDRQVVAAGVLQSGVASGSPAWRAAAATRADDAPFLTHVGVDVTRRVDGTWAVVADHTDAIRGLGSALTHRAAMTRVTGGAPADMAVQPIHDVANTLRRALHARRPRPDERSRVVILGPGSDHPAHIELSFLARQLGFHMAEPADIVIRDGHAWLRAIDGLEPLDVLYRGIGDGSVDPLEPLAVAETAGIPGVVWAAQRRGVVLANRFGAALAQTPEICAATPALADHHLGERLLMPLLVPGDPLGTEPVVIDDNGNVEMRPTIVRVHACVVGDGEVVVMRGGTGMVVDHARAVTAVKDVWVSGVVTGRSLHVPARADIGQVDLGGSVPSRVAEGMYGLGRCAERTERLARAMRTVLDRTQQDPWLASADDRRWLDGVGALLGAPAGIPLDEGVGPIVATARTALAAAATDALAEALSVREYLSTSTGRVLRRIGDLVSVVRNEPADDVLIEALDRSLIDLAALSGLSMESTVRGPAWRFLDVGRRVERSIGVVHATSSMLGPASVGDDIQHRADVLLECNESLVAYRRRYRSDVELAPVVDLLLFDGANPRSVAFQIDRLREHCVALGWVDGEHVVDSLERALLDVEAASFASITAGRRTELDLFAGSYGDMLRALADAIHVRWFTAPVRPQRQGAGRLG